MRARRTVSLLLSALMCLTLLVSAGRTLGQNAEPTTTPPSIGELGNAIAQSIGSMFSALTTPYTPPINYLDLYPGVPHSRGVDGAFILGNPNAPITLIEFADWGCPHCDAYKPVIDQFIDTYVRSGQAALEFRILPTAGGQMTVVAAQLAECADVQRPGAFWGASELLYEMAMAGKYGPTYFRDIPAILHLDIPALETCFSTVKQVEVDAEYATTINVHGTPAVLIRHGKEAPAFIQRDGVTYNGGGVPFDVLQFVMEGGGQSV